MKYALLALALITSGCTPAYYDAIGEAMSNISRNNSHRSNYSKTSDCESGYTNYYVNGKVIRCHTSYTCNVTCY